MNNNKLKKRYYEARIGFQVVGSLLKKPTLFNEDKYKILDTDFYLDFHWAIFSSINNLFVDGVEKITAIEIEGYLNRTSPKYYKIVFEDNDGFQWIEDAIEHSVLGNFDYNYNRLKKMSLLRDMIDEGNDISDILDLTEVDNKIIEQQTKEFDDTSILELLSILESRILRLKGKYELNNDGDYKRASHNSEETIARLKRGEIFGLMSNQGFKNKITYGARRKKFHLHSAGTGGGKSREALREIAGIIAVEIWDYDLEKFVINPNNPKGELSGIYIGTELDLDMEVDIILWSVVSGIETNQLNEMRLTDKERERLDYAIEVIKRSKIHLYNRPNYGISIIQNIVRKHQLEEDVYCLGIDYILLTTALVTEAMEFSKGLYKREDQLFLFVSKCFKEKVANELNIYVASSTQLNSKKNDKTVEKDEGMIRGSFALCDKVDTGSLTLLIEPQELKRIDSILKERGGFNLPMPTHVEHIFKNRGGKLTRVRIFKNINLGNMKIIELFVTDWDYKLLDVEQVIPKPYEEEEVIDVANPLF